MILLAALVIVGCATETPTSTLPSADDHEDEAEPSTIDLPIDTLTGRLIIAKSGIGIIEIDMTTGDIQTIFEQSPDSLLTAIAVSSDGMIVMSYSPPPAAGEIQLGRTGLYTLPLDGSEEPELLFEGDGDNIYFAPVWAPDENTLYYAHSSPSTISEDTTGVTLERVSLPDGEPEVLIIDAMWPAISPDGTQMVYININQKTFIDEIYIANTDGTEPELLVGPANFKTMDIPRFSRDGQTIIFGGIGTDEEESKGSSGVMAWLNASFGLQSVSAHGSVADLWTVSATGGEATRLAQVNEENIVAAYSANDEIIIFTTAEGLYLINADGSGLVQIWETLNLNSLQWLLP